MVNVDKIKTIAKESGISLTHLASSIGRGPYYFNDIKKRNGDIPNERLTIIAQKLGTTVEYLRDETDVKTPEDNDDELNAYLEELKNRPEMRMLFSLAKGATKKDVEQAAAIIEALRKGENG